MSYIQSLPIGSILRGNAYEYQIEKILGQGSFGITYLGNVKIEGTLGSINSNIRVAIKEFYMKDINGRKECTVISSNNNGIYNNYKRKFIAEAQILSKLSHPNIIKVVEAFESNNTAYYVMEYIDGGNLNDYIEQHNFLSESVALKFFEQISSALTYMHNNHMLHLDLKPSNIMMRKNGQIILIDFGLSKQYDINGSPETSTCVGKGTSGYAPIEQANYQKGKEFPVTIDVYALGATLFKMLTGERPPEASYILNEGFPTYLLQTRCVSERTISCLSKAMSSTKNQRFQSVSEFSQNICTTKNNDENTEFKYQDEVDIDFYSNISIFYYNSILKTFIICDNGLMFNLGIDDDILSVVDGRIQVNTNLYLKIIDNQINIHYVSLYEHLNTLCLFNEIKSLPLFIVAYGGSLNLIDVVKFLIDSFGYVPQNVKIFNKGSLSAFYNGTTEMVYNIKNECNYIKINCPQEQYMVDASEGIVEIEFCDAFEENKAFQELTSFPKEISSKNNIDYILGALIYLKSVLLEIPSYKNFLLLDAIPFNISVGIFENNQEVLIARGQHIPARKSEKIEKGYADILYIKLDNKLLTFKLDDCFKKERYIDFTIDIAQGMLISFEIKSEYSWTKFSIHDLLQFDKKSST